MSRLRELAEEETRLSMTPLIDITFLLLVFFLCTIRFKTLDQKLSAYLPDRVGGNSGAVIDVEDVTVDIRVRAAGERRDAGDVSRPWSGEGPFRYVDRVVEYRVGPRVCAGFDALVERLAFLHDADPERAAVIDARPGAIYSDAVLALDALRAAGFEDVTFVGRRE